MITTSKPSYIRRRRAHNTHVVDQVMRVSNVMQNTALERTFLGYLRTSLAFVMMGIVIAQLFRLYELPISEIEMPYYNASIPLSTACTAVGMIILLLGACRFYRSQAAMMRGKCLAGGWEVYTVMVLSIAVSPKDSSASRADSPY